VPRTLSSAWTFFYKFLLPVVWITGLTLGARASAYGKIADASGSPSASISQHAVMLLFFVGLAGFAALAWFCAPLKRVRLAEDGGSLLVSNYFSEWVVPAGLITAVTQNRWIKLRPITIQLRTDPGCGTRVVFMPPLRIIFRFWHEDPEVDELRTLAATHSLV